MHFIPFPWYDTIILSLRQCLTPGDPCTCHLFSHYFAAVIIMVKWSLCARSGPQELALPIEPSKQSCKVWIQVPVRKMSLASANGNSDSSWLGDEYLSLVALPSEHHHPLPRTCIFHFPSQLFAFKSLCQGLVLGYPNWDNRRWYDSGSKNWPALCDKCGMNKQTIPVLLEQKVDGVIDNKEFY